MVHLGGIGDLLLTTPAIARLAQEGPVELAGRCERLELLTASGIATDAHSLESVDFESIFSSPTPRLHAFIQRFDRIVLWIRDDGTLVETLHACGVKDVRAFSGLPQGAAGRHASAYYLECLGYGRAPEPTRLCIAPAQSTNDVVIHPGSGGRLKNWPLSSFAHLAEDLTTHGRRVVWSLGPAEEGQRVPSGATTLSALSLVQLAAELAAAKLYFGNDSGITHLAAAVGVPVVAVFGPTNPEVWAPLGSHVRVVRGEPWPRWESVMQAAAPLLEMR